MNKITTIVSDLGGVYLNRGIWKFWEWLEKEKGVEQDTAIKVFLQYYKSYFSGDISEENFWDDLLSNFDLPSNPEDREFYRNKLLNFFELRKEVVETLESLRSSGYKLVLLSDQSKEWWPILNEKFSISQDFDEVFVSAELGLTKKSPELFSLIIEKLNAQPGEILFIDDLESNLFQPRKLGMKTFLFEEKNTDAFKKFVAGLES